MNTSQPCLILMLKYPDPGLVKTRLGREIGFENSARVYRLLVAGVMRVLRGLEHPVLICCDPVRSFEAYRKWLGKEHGFFLQQGKDLGERMHAAFRQAFEHGYPGAVLLGSDISGLERDIVEQALAWLQQQRPVLGPAEDGGYYMLGLERTDLDYSFFSHIPWSTSRVLEMTVQRMKKKGLTPCMMPQLRDVDTLEDLCMLFPGFSGGYPDEPGSREWFIEACMISLQKVLLQR